MPLSQPDYFRYFAAGPEVRRWGVGLTGAGRTCVPARSPYPPARHPADHDFTWEHGRVLEALQLVYIVEGAGVFESQATGRCRVEAGTAIALLPGVWHRYRPDPDTGWTESWAEIQGPLVNTLRRAGVFAAGRAVRVIQPESGFEDALAAVHQRARVAEGSFDPELAAVAFGLLAAWEKAGRVQPARSRMLKAVSAAERYLADQLCSPVNIQDLARQLGVGYSHFRRAFRAHTGFAPWQYVLHLRLSRARRLLAASDATLDEVASRLGFSSGFHLSSAFKRAYGSSPEHWRAELAASRPRKGE